MNAGTVVTIPMLFLTACATTAVEPRIEVREVRVPVAIPCVAATFPDPPKTPDTPAALKATDADGRYRLLSAGYGPKGAWIDAAAAQLRLCKKAAP